MDRSIAVSPRWCGSFSTVGFSKMASRAWSARAVAPSSSSLSAAGVATSARYNLN
jgi:hypothetical protein